MPNTLIVHCTPAHHHKGVIINPETDNDVDHLIEGTVLYGSYTIQPPTTRQGEAKSPDQDDIDALKVLMATILDFSGQALGSGAADDPHPVPDNNPDLKLKPLLLVARSDDGRIEGLPRRRRWPIEEFNWAQVMRPDHSIGLIGERIRDLLCKEECSVGSTVGEFRDVLDWATQKVLQGCCVQVSYISEPVAPDMHTNPVGVAKYMRKAVTHIAEGLGLGHVPHIMDA